MFSICVIYHLAFVLIDFHCLLNEKRCKKLRDSKGKRSIFRRVSRLKGGNFGDHKSVGGGVWELKIDAGSGYRVYSAQAGKVLLLLLCCGDKSTQQRDIQNAKTAWHDWQARQHEDGALT